jgi:hypothetical protein
MNFAATTGGRRTRKNSRKASRKNTRRNMMGGTSMNSKLGGMVGALGAMPQEGGKMARVGSRTQVMNGNAHHTSGGLTRKDLKYNKHGRIVSRKASEAGKKALKRLEKAGYKARKGTFKLFKKAKKGSRKH